MCLFWAGAFFSWPTPADASDQVRYISNRIKIERPETPLPAPPEKAPEPLAQKPEAPEAPAAAPPVEVETPPPAEVAEAPAPVLETGMADIFGKEGRLYSSKGRVDPFEPFLHKAEAKATPGIQQILQIRPPRTPLEKVDLSQLKLTAVLQTSGQTQALVEEASGKGYVVTEGTYIGTQGGRVSKILKDRVVVKERYLDVFGKIAVRDRELKLQKEPGE